jgi:hypothetical protein
VPLNLNDLEDAEKFQEHFVKPLVDAVRKEISPLARTVYATRTRVAKLERSQARAFIGFAGVSVAVGLAFDWFKKKIGLLIALTLMLTMIGCAATPHLSKVPDSVPAVGNSMAKAQAHTETTGRMIEAAKPEATPAGKTILNLGSQEVDATKQELAQGQKDLKAVSAQRDSLEGDNVKQAITIAEITSGWGYQLQLFVERAFWIIVGWVASHFILGILGLLIAGPAGQLLARAGAAVNPFTWFQTIRDNIHFNKVCP